MEAPCKFAALFDLDGVLMNTEPEYTRFWQMIDSRFPTGVDNFAFVIKGSTLDKIFNRYFPDMQVRKEIYRLLVERELDFKYEEFDDTESFVSMLREHQIPCIVVTSSNRKKMEEVYRQLPSFKALLPDLICDEDVTRSKPDPEGYIKGAQRLGMPIEKCIVFEDSLAGLEAGRRSGAKVVALATSLSKEVLKDKADLVADHLSDITYKMLVDLFK